MGKRSTVPGGPDQDQQALERCLAGDQEAYRLLFDKYRERMYALAYGYVGNREDALDIVQETFAKAFSSLSGFKGEASFASWLRRIAVNSCIDYRRRSVARRPGEDEPPPSGLSQAARQGAEAPGEAAQVRELAALAQEAVTRLPKAQRMTFVMRVKEGLSYKEIAEAMGCSIGTVMSRLFNARQRLRRARAGKVEL